MFSTKLPSSHPPDVQQVSVTPNLAVSWLGLHTCVELHGEQSPSSAEYIYLSPTPARRPPAHHATQHAGPFPLNAPIIQNGAAPSTWTAGSRFSPACTPACYACLHWARSRHGASRRCRWRGECAAMQVGHWRSEARRPACERHIFAPVFDGASPEPREYLPSSPRYLVQRPPPVSPANGWRSPGLSLDHTAGSATSSSSLQRRPSFSRCSRSSFSSPPAVLRLCRRSSTRPL